MLCILISLKIYRNCKNLLSVGAPPAPVVGWDPKWGIDNKKGTLPSIATYPTEYTGIPYGV